MQEKREGKKTFGERLQNHPVLVLGGVFVAAAGLIAILYEGLRVAPLKEEIERLTKTETPALVHDPQERPTARPLSEVAPVLVNWIRHHVVGLSATGAARKRSGAAVDYDAAAIRTGSFGKSAPPCFRWHITAGRYTLLADHGFRVSANETTYVMLKRHSSTEYELIYDVPGGSKGDYLLAPLLVLSQRGPISRPLTNILTSSTEDCPT
jgi:hypothetical protein